MTYPLLTKDALNKMLSTTSPHSFKFNIARMHQIYRLPTNDAPTLDVGQDPIVRLDGFFKTLSDEVSEYNTSESKDKPSIRDKILTYRDYAITSHVDFQKLEDLRQEILTDLADWFTDLTVYIRSEAMKFGIPLEETQEAVMASNFSKIKGGVTGTPTYDENGKVQKDMSCFVPPESAIRTILFGIRGPRHPYENIDGE